MNSLKELLDKLEAESKERMQDELNDYESISCEVGIQSTIKEIRSWLEEHSFSQKVNDLENITLVRVE
jgi:hypothetical protein